MDSVSRAPDDITSNIGTFLIKDEKIKQKRTKIKKIKIKIDIELSFYNYVRNSNERNSSNYKINIISNSLWKK